MRTKIVELLRDFEHKYEIRILLAVTSGSRGLGYSSPESDWDVRFIYVHKPEWYFSVAPTDDVIEYVDAASGLDVEGFDLKKALALLTKTNPIESDWLHTKDILIVDEDFLGRMLTFERMCYNTKRAMYHFYSISVKHNERYLDKEITLKRFIYYMRGMLACRWIERNGCHPPIIVDELIDATITDNEKVRLAAHNLLASKREGKTHDKDIVESGLVDYVFSMQEYYNELLHNSRINKPSFDYRELSKFLMDTVMNH